MKKVFVNKKILLGLLTMLMVFAIIIVSSFWPFILDLTRIGTTEFITDQMIIMAITITALLSMMFIAQASNAQNKDSELAKARVEFLESVKKITSRSAFMQWIKRVLQPQDRKDIAEQGMMRIGVPYEVYGLTDSEIKTLTVAQKFGDIFYKSLTQKQIDDVLKLKKMVAKVKFVSPNYYTSYKSWMINKNLSQIASTENKKKISTVLFQLVFKLIVSFTGAALFISLVRDLSIEPDAIQSWMRFLSRVFAYTTSSFLGYLLGCKLNDLDAFYINKRVEAQKLYLEDKEFQPIDEGKEEFKQRVLGEEHKLLEQSAHLIEQKGEAK